MDAPGIASALKTQPVYVADGLPPTTGSNITGLLSQSDGIKVVVLEDGQPTDSLAKQVLATQPDGTVLIVASGDDVTAVANAMPSGDLSDLLARAENVSTNGLDTVRTLVTNVHTWQAAHPQTVTATQQPGDPMYLVPIGIVSVPVLIAIVAALIVFRRRGHKAYYGTAVRGDAPRNFRPFIAELMEQREQIKSGQMRKAIETLCEHVEAYFKRVDSWESGADALRSQLHDANEVVAVFRAIEQEPIYYRDPAKAKGQGLTAITGLSASVLESVRSENARALVNYSVSTKILDAQRYR